MMSDRRLRLLCLDGGGVRGLATLYLLRQILSYAGNPKPHEFFDMICGTSTGGLIAIMLGRLHMSVQECIETYTAMMDEIFHKKSFLPFKLNGNISSRYATKILEDNIKKIITSAKIPVDEKMRETNPECQVFVVALDPLGGNAVRFTNYEKHNKQNDLYRNATIWEAARATSSAPTFFDPIEIRCDGIAREFIDGGLGHNNPVNQLWMEAQAEFGPGALEPQIRFTLSVGTGMPSMKVMGKSLYKFADTIRKRAAETQKTADEFLRMHPELDNNDGYFRFNPPYLDDVGLDEASKADIVQQRTEDYGEQVQVGKDMRRFGVIALDPELPLRPIADRSYVRREGPLFSVLDRSALYIWPRGETYWSYLTVDAYNIYERIYDLCDKAGSASGMVHINSFLQQIERAKSPSRPVAENIWKRLLGPNQIDRPMSSRYPKAFVMAVPYMLHVEQCFKTEKPRLENGEIGVDERRREALKRFSHWVPCICQRSHACTNEWNFTNEVGLARGGGTDCKISTFLKKRGTMSSLFKSKEQVWLKKMYANWSEPQNI